MTIAYRDIATSLLRFTADIVTEINTLGDFSLTPIDFDQHADLGKLPPGDLFGFSRWEMEKPEGEFGLYIDGLLGFSVAHDLNYERLNQYYLNHLVNIVSDRNTHIAIYKGGTDIEEQVGQLIFADYFKVLALGNNDSRVFKFIQVSLRTPQLLKH